jgi:hypothetical protein
MSRSFLLKGVVGIAIVVCSLSLTGCPSQQVVVIDNFPEFSLDKLWSDCVSFFYGGSSSPLEVGDIIVGTGGGGFLRRLTAIDESQGKITTDTEFVSLAEAVEAGSLDGSVTFNQDDFVKSGVPLAKSADMTIDLSGITI